ncbi:hypothetical protein BDV95DRAFT_221441 [Massariosphaeria phaeospora]|uniref:Secreted protein n=1 Tax=Massariosphaeria phaeospora TaxID=100035 RepID=A0A7C8IMV2_9PLEO|nr:hypothetical protein BDV95DRAFT_221441 [Massariosphaeria phaeospora]
MRWPFARLLASAIAATAAAPFAARPALFLSCAWPTAPVAPRRAALTDTDTDPRGRLPRRPSAALLRRAVTSDVQNSPSLEPPSQSHSPSYITTTGAPSAASSLCPNRRRPPSPPADALETACTRPTLPPARNSFHASIERARTHAHGTTPLCPSPNPVDDHPLFRHSWYVFLHGSAETGPSSFVSAPW